MAGDRETGVTIHRDASRRSTPARSPRSARSRSAPDDDAGAVYARAAELAADLLDDVLARRRRFEPQPEDGVTYAEKIAPGRPRARPRSRPAAELVDRVRALSPHIGARAELDGRPVIVWRARVEDGALRAARGAAGGAAAHDVRRVPAAACGDVSPARRGGVRGRPAGLRGRRLRRPRAPHRGRGARPARPGARAAARLRDGAARPDARPRDRDARPAAGAQARPAGAGGAAARRLPARLPRRRRAARGGQRVGRARPRGAARAGGAVHERGAAAARARGSAPLLDSLPGGALRHSYPDWVAEVWRRDFGRRRRSR